MEIKVSKIRLCDSDNLKAVVSVLIDDKVAVHDIKVIATPDKMFISMPSKPDKNGKYRDVVHPISCEVREQISTIIIDAYERLTLLQYDEHPEIS